jgi:hypothetical protein
MGNGRKWDGVGKKSNRELAYLEREKQFTRTGILG